MKAEELKTILDQHRLWIESDGVRGKRADLRSANLCNKDLHCADLRRADLSYADLVGANLCYANLSNADLRGATLLEANLSFANLSNAELRYSNLVNAKLHRAQLRYADLRGADIDYATWPLSCGSLSPKIDSRIAAQLLYHALRAMQSCSDDPDVAAVLSSEACLRLANSFHRVGECRRIKFSGN